MLSWLDRPANRIAVVVVLLIGAVAAQLFPSVAQANNFTTVYLRLDRMKAGGVATGGTLCARATVAQTEATVAITFPSTYTVTPTAGNWTTDTTAQTTWPAGASAWPSIQSSATSATSPANVVTWTSGDLNVANTYCFNFSGTSTLQTAAAAANDQQANVTTRTSAPAIIDSSDIALANIADDQILVTATVPPIFQFAITPDNSEPFGNLSTSITNTSGTIVTVNTNAKGGWIAWAKDSNQGLNSPSASYTIPTIGTVNGAPSQLTAGSPGYVMDVDATDTGTSVCTATADAEYAATQPTTHGGTLSANFQKIGGCSGGTSNGDSLTLVEYAAIAVTTPAATDYTDLITVVGAGSF